MFLENPQNGSKKFFESVNDGCKCKTLKMEAAVYSETMVVP
jgi:hypothetical protein